MEVLFLGLLDKWIGYSLACSANGLDILWPARQMDWIFLGLLGKWIGYSLACSTNGLDIPWPARQLVGKTRWVFRQPHGVSIGCFYADDFPS
jgi:hypothetical protein